MHPANLAARNDSARRRIRTAAAALADALDLPPIESLTAAEQRQPEVRQMRELETIADLLDRIAAALEVSHART